MRREPSNPGLALDWSKARLGDPLPCAACGTPALLRHPVTGRPHHKVCSDRLFADRADRLERAAADSAGDVA